MTHPIVNAASAPPSPAVSGGLAPVQVQLGAAVTPRRAILILGMHRSGTSALTKVLNMCGLDLPAVLVPGRDDNVPQGFSNPGKSSAFTKRCSRRWGPAGTI